KVVLLVRRAAVFSNWLGLKNSVLKVGGGKEVVIDFSDTRFVDHSTMEKLHELERDLEAAGGKLTVAGLDNHTPMSNHRLAARKNSGNGKKTSDPAPSEIAA